MCKWTPSSSINLHCIQGGLFSFLPGGSPCSPCRLHSLLVLDDGESSFSSAYCATIPMWKDVEIRSPHVVPLTPWEESISCHQVGLWKPWLPIWLFLTPSWPGCWESHCNLTRTGIQDPHLAFADVGGVGDSFFHISVVECLLCKNVLCCHFSTPLDTESRFFLRSIFSFFAHAFYHFWFSVFSSSESGIYEAGRKPKEITVAAWVPRSLATLPSLHL